MTDLLAGWKRLCAPPGSCSRWGTRQAPPIAPTSRAFDAARAVLGTSAGVEVEAIRTHRGITHAFEVEIVRAGLIERETGKLLTLLMEMRWAADYPIAVLTLADAARAVAAAEAFLDKCAPLTATRRPAP